MFLGVFAVVNVDCDWKQVYEKRLKQGGACMPKGERRAECLETGKKPTHPRKHKNWK